MDEKTTMGQPLRSMEDEETIDLMELARLLWAHIADRGSSCCGSADLPAGVYVCAYTQVSGFYQYDREYPAG